MELTIQTDHKWKHLKYRNEVPDRVLADQFEHLPEGEYEDGFIRYRGQYYHTTDFTRINDCMWIEHGEDLRDWHGYVTNNYFSSVLIRLSADGERYQIGTYCS